MTSDWEICDYYIKEDDEELYNRILKSVEELASYDKNEYEDGHFAYVITLSQEMYEEYLS